jgi:serine phosphatase RsbU (regulator of sigma subunit)
VKFGDRDKAFSFFNKSLDLAKKIRSADFLMRTSKLLARLHKEAGQYQESLKYLNSYMQIKDSLSNADLKQQVLRKELQFDYELKHAADSIKNHELQRVKDAELKMQQAKIEKEQSLKYGLILIIILVGLFSVYLYTRLRIIRDQKKLIEEQKKVVDEWKKDITDSINYAKKIQDAQLTSHEYMKKALPDSFVLYRPKDIVSGDYYWVYENNDQVFFTVADCTGHGVPGAFMSMIGMSLLNELIIENGLKEPDKVLFEMRGLIIKTLSQDGDVVEAKDGMDMALCRWDKKENKIIYSGAFNGLYLIRNGKLLEYKPNRRPVGYYLGKDIPFTKEEVTLEKGDMLYIFSDGFSDQFGGENGKKYSTKRYKDLLLKISALSCDEQSKALNEELTSWRGEQEQIDDVCIMGVRF